MSEKKDDKRYFKNKPYSDTLFDFYVRYMDGNAAGASGAESTRNRQFRELLTGYSETYGTSVSREQEGMFVNEAGDAKGISKIEMNKVYGFLNLSPENIVTRIAILRALSAAKEPVPEQIVKTLIGIEDETLWNEDSLPYDNHYKVKKNVYEEAMKELIRAGMVTRDSEQNNARYSLSTDVFHGISPNKVYSFLNFSDHALPFSGIIHSLYSVYASAPKNIAKDKENKQIFNKKDELYRVRKVEHVSPNLVLLEYVFWFLLSGYSEKKIVAFRYHNAKDNLQYRTKNAKDNTIIHAIPYRVVYDNIFSRLFFLGYNLETKKMECFNADSILPEALEDDKHAEYEGLSYLEEVKETEQMLATAWTVYGPEQETPQPIIVRFRNTPTNYQRVRNESRHGEVTEEEGAIKLSIVVNSPREMRPWLRSFGNSIISVEPEWFADELRNENQKTLAFYEEEIDLGD